MDRPCGGEVGWRDTLASRAQLRYGMAEHTAFRPTVSDYVSGDSAMLGLSVDGRRHVRQVMTATVL